MTINNKKIYIWKRWIFKYLGVISSEDNNHQIVLQERIKMIIKHNLCYRNL
jgi:hypothetical protein